MYIDIYTGTIRRYITVPRKYIYFVENKIINIRPTMSP